MRGRDQIPRVKEVKFQPEIRDNKGNRVQTQRDKHKRFKKNSIENQKSSKREVNKYAGAKRGRKNSKTEKKCLGKKRERGKPKRASSKKCSKNKSKEDLKSNIISIVKDYEKISLMKLKKELVHHFGIDCTKPRKKAQLRETLGKAVEVGLIEKLKASYTIPGFKEDAKEDDFSDDEPYIDEPYIPPYYKGFSRFRADGKVYELPKAVLAKFFEEHDVQGAQYGPTYYHCDDDRSLGDLNAASVHFPSDGCCMHDHFGGSYFDEYEGDFLDGIDCPECSLSKMIFEHFNI
eukprot:jgi/Bigna1/143798/aug1.81_g18506